MSSGDYKNEEDPALFKSSKTGRGPLSDDWLREHSKAAHDPNVKTAIMCAYKLCKVEFRYWGMQSKIERFIHDVGELSHDSDTFQAKQQGGVGPYIRYHNCHKYMYATSP